MKVNRFIQQTVVVSATLILIIQLASSTEIKNEDLKTEPPKVSADKTESSLQGGQPTSGRSMETESVVPQPKKDRASATRAGRMLDLDRLAGDIGKEEQLAKERSLSGHRQSRILNEDIPLGVETKSGNKLEGRSKGKSKKKMAIKGFIPIVSLESAKEGKHFENPLESSQDDEQEDESEPEQQSQFSPVNTKEQLMSSYGGQTSMGHASFAAPQPTGGHNQQLSSSWQPSNNQATYTDQDASRANRKLSGSLLSGLAAPKRLVSTLVQPPMNSLQMGPQQFEPTSECICVPFFQCRNGYLSESQLSKSQLHQIGFQNSAMNSFSGVPFSAYQQQTPRTLASQTPLMAAANNLYSQNSGNLMAQIPNQNLQQQQQLTVSKNPLLSSDQQQQQILNDIYEQLRKNIDNEQLMQQLRKDQPAYLALDERSKVGAQQEESAQNATAMDSDLLGRSLLNPLGRRQSMAQKCGIMRTCCKIPPSLQQAQAIRGAQYQRGLQQSGFTARPVTEWEPAYQFLQPVRAPYPPQNSIAAQQVDQQVATSALAPSFQQNQPMGGGLGVGNFPGAEQAQRPPVGSFMAGRCGTRQTMGITGRVQNLQPAPGSETSAEFGEFPAHAAILKRVGPGDSLFVCSAALVSNMWLATAAHCVRRQRAEELKVRLGEWDVNRDDEFYPYVELNIREIIIHPDFQASSLVNDLALLRLDSAIDPQQMPHIAPACLATPDETFAQQRCWLAGWGKDAFGQQGTFQNVLKKVDLPVINRQECENALRHQTKLGRYFRLHASALCAGGERGKDACEGDGGAGLYCSEPESGLTKLAGLVSWGIGCGQRGVPGVYTNVAAFYNWIESIVANSGEESLYLELNGVPDNRFKSLVSERSNSNATLVANDASDSRGQLTTANNGTASEQQVASGSNEELESRAG